MKNRRSCAWTGLLLLAAGCGGRGVRVSYDIAPPRTPGPPTSESPAAPTPPPTRAPDPTRVASAPTPAPPAATELVVPDRPVLGVPITTRVDLDAPYEILVKLTREDGSVVAEDKISENGWGVSRSLEAVPPGRYRLRLTAYPHLDAYPLYNKVIELAPEFPPAFHFGLLSLDLPQEGSFVVRRGLRYQLRETPSFRPVRSGPLEELAVRTTFGDTLPNRLILPFGSYDLVLEDPDRKDDVELVAFDGLAMDRSDPIEFELDADNPSVLLDLLGLLRVKGVHEPDLPAPSATPRRRRW